MLKFDIHLNCKYEIAISHFHCTAMFEKTKSTDALLDPLPTLGFCNVQYHPKCKIMPSWKLC